MLLIAVGKLKPGPERALFDRYNARLRPRLDVVEIGEAAGPAAVAKRREAGAMLAALPGGAVVVALDPGGTMAGSEGFASQIGRWRERGRVVFLIGGAEGLGEPALERAEAAVSLGPMTWPHMLARVLLVEQLYRAQTILAGHPYHRGG